MINLSIIIVSYNSKEDLARLLPSVFSSQTRYSYEVILVDNGSSDETVEYIERFIDVKGALCQAWQRAPLTLIRNQNTGFAHGNNLGIKRARGEYVLLLNPDTKIQPDTLEIMLNFMESKQEVGISGCKVIKPDGSLDLACRRKFPNLWNSFLRLAKISNRNYNITNINPDKEMEIDSVMGAFLLIRKSVIEKIGLLDEDFFMYGEDIDWCWRCKEAGYKVWYFPKTFITHFKGSSSKKIPFKSLKWFHEAMWIFYCKHYKIKYPFILNWFVWLGINFRLVALMLINVIRKEKRVSK